MAAPTPSPAAPGTDTIRIGGNGVPDSTALAITETAEGDSRIDLTASLADGTDGGPILVEGVTGLDDDFAFG